MSAPEQRAINLSRVKHCGQEWDIMPQVAGGRQCLHCDKRIIDMTRLTPAEIARIHLSSAEPVCGRYTDEQLSGMPHEIPSSDPWRRSPVVVSLISLLLAEPTESVAQVNVPTEQDARVAEADAGRDDPMNVTTAPDSLLVRGRVLERAGKELQGVPFVNVRVLGTDIGAATDFDGGFTLDLSPLEGRMDSVTVEVHFIGYARQQRRIAVHGTNELVFDLTNSVQSAIVYAVKFKRPPLHKRVWWGVRGLFSGRR